MKKQLPLVSHFFLMAFLVMACTKDVGVFTKVEFEVIEEHSSVGFINEALPTDITVIPEAEIEGYLYTFTYKMTSGNGRFEDIDGKQFGEGEKISLTPLSASVMYVGVEKGLHTVDITAEDNFGISQEITLSYMITDVPVTWTATSEVEQVELGKSVEISLVLDNSDSTIDITYESSHNIPDDNGTLIALSDSTVIALGEFKPLELGIRSLLFTPSALGAIELDFPLKDSNGQEIIATLPILVVGVVPVISIDLGEHDEIEMQVGGTLECPVSFLPINATDKGITWVSSDLTVVTVDADGTFTGIGVGSATITATSISNPEAVGTVIVEVKAAPPVPVTSITIVQVGSSVDVSTRQLTVSILPENATDINVTWFSDNTDVAIIDESGLLIGLSPGTATITATSVSDPEVSGSAQIEISGASLLSANDIVSFALNGQIETATIDLEQHTVSVTVPDGTALNVAPIIFAVSEEATATPGILQSRNFALPVEYTVTAGNGVQQLWTVNVTVLVVPGVDNEAPTAVDDARATLVDNAISFDPRANDSDPENDTLTITAVGSVNPTGSGTVEFDGQSVTFTPTAGISQDANFTYTINDGNGNDATATVNVTVGIIPDTTAPIITRTGGDASLTVGQDYNEEGATAIDNVDGEINDRIVITGSVNTTAEGIYTVAYNVSDAAGNAAAEVTRSVTVTAATPANQPPTAVDDTRETAVGAPISFDPRANDTDPENDTLTLTAVGPVSPAGSGTVDFDGQSVTFTPAAGSTQAATFGYTVNDGNTGNDATASITVTVVAEPDTEAPEITLNGGDIDLTVGDTYTEAGARAIDNIDGNITENILITGSVDTNTADTYIVRYNVSDAAGNAAAEVTRSVTVTAATPANQPPTAVDDTRETAVGVPISFDPRANDTDPENDTLTLTAVGPVSPAGSGTVAFDGQSVTFTPAAGSTQAATFGYTVNDGNTGNDATANITVNIAAVPNNPPTAQNIAINVVENSSNNSIDLSANVADTDPGDVLILSISTTPANGSATVSGNTTISYTPNTDYDGADSIGFTVDDGNGGSASATITIEVEVGNTTPTADDFSVTVEEDSSNNPIDLSPHIADADTGDVLTVSINSQPANGAASVSGTNIIYTPNSGFDLEDGIGYTVTDNQGASATGTITVTVNPISNTAPIANDDFFEVLENGTLNRTVFSDNGNGADSDPDLDSIAVDQINNNAASVGTTVNGSTGGRFTIGANGDLNFDTNGDYDGLNDGETRETTAIYRISDGNGAFDAAVITVRINGISPTNISPTVEAGDNIEIILPVNSVNLSGTSGDSDGTVTTQWTQDSGPTIATITSPASLATAINNLSEGTYIFRLTATDNDSATEFDIVTVTVNEPENNPPTANNFVLTVAQDATVSFAFVSSGNVQDADGDTLSITVEVPPSKGSLSQVATDGYVYTPNANEIGPDSFVYRVDDGNGGTVDRTVSITITEAQNNPPTANNFTLTVIENDIVDFDIIVRGEVQDLDMDALTINISTEPTKGNISEVAPQNYIYVPRNGETGQDTFVYRVADGNGGSVEATVSITITPVGNRPPIANDDLFGVRNTGTSLISIRTNDSDPDGDIFALTSNFTQPSSGSVSFASGPNSAFLYEPVSGFVGNVTFTYEISDGEFTDTAIVTLRVRNEPGVNGSCPDPTDATDTDCPCGPNTQIPICQ